MKYVSVVFGLTVANFAWQAMQAVPDWHTAVERSWFQLGAVVAVAVCSLD